MDLTIFAATGGVGRHLLRLATAAGHNVTAVVRDPAGLSDAEQVRVVRADLADAEPVVLKPAISGADAVLSAVGPRNEADLGVAAKGTQAIAAAMREAGVRRLVVVSAAHAGTVPTAGRPHPPKHDAGDGLFTRLLLAPLLRSMLRRRLADLAQMEENLRIGDLDWTVIRPPRLTDDPLNVNYRTAYGQNVRGGGSVSRASVAHLMLQVVGMPETVRQTISVAD